MKAGTYSKVDTVIILPTHKIVVLGNGKPMYEIFVSSIIGHSFEYVCFPVNADGSVDKSSDWIHNSVRSNTPHDIDRMCYKLLAKVIYNENIVDMPDIHIDNFFENTTTDDANTIYDICENHVPCIFVDENFNRIESVNS